MKVIIQPPSPTADENIVRDSRGGGWGLGCTFDSHVDEEECRADPCDFGFERFFRAAACFLVLAWVLNAVYFASLSPESQSEADKFED